MATTDQDQKAAPNEHQLDRSSQDKDSLQRLANPDPADDIPDHEYPGTLRLTAIMVSLMLSIFLVSQSSWRRDPCP